MPSYMYSVNYTNESWAEQVKRPKNRLTALKPMIEGMGGKIVACYYTFGKEDLILIVDMPDNVTAAAFSIAAAGGAGDERRHHCPDADGRRREGVEEGRHRALRPTEVAFGLRPDRPAPTGADRPEAGSAA